MLTATSEIDLSSNLANKKAARGRTPNLIYGQVRRRSILLIEDDPKIALALKIRLNHEGYEVTHACNAALGLQWAHDEGFLADVALLDIMLPGIDGVTVAESFLETDALVDLPVVFMTGTRDPQLRRRAAQLRPEAVLEKPFDFPALLDAIESAL